MAGFGIALGGFGEGLSRGYGIGTDMADRRDKKNKQKLLDDAITSGRSEYDAAVAAGTAKPDDVTGILRYTYPKLLGPMLQNGDLQGAQALQTWITSDDTRKGTSLFASGMLKAQTGDMKGAITDFVAAGKVKGYGADYKIGDPLEVKGADGKVTGYQVKITDAGGADHTLDFKSADDIIRFGATYLNPEAAYADWKTSSAEAAKMDADLATYRAKKGIDQEYATGKDAPSDLELRKQAFAELKDTEAYALGSTADQEKMISARVAQLKSAIGIKGGAAGPGTAPPPVTAPRVIVDTVTGKPVTTATTAAAPTTTTAQPPAPPAPLTGGAADRAAAAALANARAAAVKAGLPATSVGITGDPVARDPALSPPAAVGLGPPQRATPAISGPRPPGAATTAAAPAPAPAATPDYSAAITAAQRKLQEGIPARTVAFGLRVAGVPIELWPDAARAMAPPAQTPPQASTPLPAPATAQPAPQPSPQPAPPAPAAATPAPAAAVTTPPATPAAAPSAVPPGPPQRATPAISGKPRAAVTPTTTGQAIAKVKAVVGPKVPTTTPSGKSISEVAKVGNDPRTIAAAYLGQHEKRDTTAITEFIKKTAGIDINPATTAWCAAWLNAVLAAGGNKQSEGNRLSAYSFESYGADARSNPQAGDIVVLRFKDGGGHVGIIDGFENDGKTVRVLGGNQSDSVKVSNFNAGDISAVRRIETLDGAPPGGAPGRTIQLANETVSAPAKTTSKPTNVVAEVNKALGLLTQGPAAQGFMRGLTGDQAYGGNRPNKGDKLDMAPGIGDRTDFSTLTTKGMEEWYDRTKFTRMFDVTFGTPPGESGLTSEMLKQAYDRAENGKSLQRLVAMLGFLGAVAEGAGTPTKAMTEAEAGSKARGDAASAWENLVKVFDQTKGTDG